MDKEKLEYFKQKLLREKELIELELTDIGARHSAVDWEATAGDLDVDPADKDSLADKSEEIQTNSAIVENLENRLHEIEKAFKKIEEDTYGICEVCGQPIEEKRLEVNPAATRCVQHA